MNGFLNFSTSTNIKNLLGRDLMTDEITAVFELVKNAYDADATRVKIEFLNLTNGSGTITIEDNGIGMDLDDIKRFWMVIGTNSKKNKQYTQKFMRPLNGDKGIGRFSADRLGKKLILSSNKEDDDKEIVLEIDWTRFENQYKDIDEVEVPYAVKPRDSKCKTGVTLKIDNLRDNWSRSSIEKLIKNLRQLKSPLSVKDYFDIIINVPDYDIYALTIEPYELDTISSFWISAEILPENTSLIRVTIVRDGIRYYEEHCNNYTFGPIVSKIYFFDQGDKIRFNSRIGMSVKDFGNIRLYRDDFRIYPYGESYNDWLDLDLRKTQGYSRFFGSRELIGFVQITKQHNDNIIAPTNRQGIVENMYSEQLRDFIINFPVKILERYFFKNVHNDTFIRSKENMHFAVDRLKEVTKEIKKASPETARILKQITDVVTKSQDDQTEFVKNQFEVLEVYKRAASKEMLLSRVIHQSLIKIKNIQSANYLLGDIIDQVENSLDMQAKLPEDLRKYSNKIDTLSNEAKIYLKKTRDNLIRKKGKELLNLRKSIQVMLYDFHEDCVANNIQLDFLCQENIILNIDKNDLQVIIENFVSNSIKSLHEVNGRERVITIEVIETEDNIIIIFKDNGQGVPESIRDKIFEPFFTTTDGFGIGLSIVSEIVEEYRGKLNLAVNYESGAEFQIRFRR